jgi:hypothetical protein
VLIGFDLFLLEKCVMVSCSRLGDVCSVALNVDFGIVREGSGHGQSCHVY